MNHLLPNLNLLFAFISGVFFLLFFLVSMYEKEYRASFVSIILGSLLFIFFYLISKSPTLSAIVFLLIIFTFIFLFLQPYKNIDNKEQPIESFFDERDIVFSRNELKHNSKEFHEYYSKNPKKFHIDNVFRFSPKLASKNSKQYHPYFSEKARDYFKEIEHLTEFRTGGVSSTEITGIKEHFTSSIIEELKKLGAENIGICELKKKHLYTIHGRKRNYGNIQQNQHKYAIAFIVEMDRDKNRTAPLSPTIMETAWQYLNAAKIAIEGAKFIRNLGYDAKAHFDENYDVICPLVASDAGLGEIGRMGILITPQFGPRCRIGVITTSLELIVNENKKNSSIEEFCSVCKKCAVNCPVQAISHKEKINSKRKANWCIDDAKCYTYWRKIGTDCGRCMSVCPYSHPNNFLHKSIKYLIKISPAFRVIAIYLDDLFYGKRPKPLPIWRLKQARSADTN